MKKIVTEAKGYGVVQRDFMTMKLSVFAKCVYTLLRTYSGDKQSCYPSLKTICNDLQISKSTVIRAIKDLESLNLVAVKRSKKQGSNENTVNTYIPLSVMIEIDLDKLVSDAQNQDLGGTPQTPRGTPQTPGVVSDVDSKNNNIKKNKEETLNINTEQSSVDSQPDLFYSNNLAKTIDKKEEPNKKILTVYQRIVDFWLKEFHEGWSFSSTDGKKVKSLIKKLEKSLASTGKELSDDNVVNLFKAFCSKLPGYYQSETLSVLDSKYDSIVEKIKNNNTNGKQPSATKFTGFKYDVEDPRERADWAANL